MVQRSALICALALLWALPARAEILLTQTGMLRSAGGMGVDGEYKMIFSLYNSPTSLVGLWSETQQNVSVVGGVFRVVLGGSEPLTTAMLTDSPEVYLGVSVDGEPELPRLQLGRVAFTVVADHATTAAGLAGPIEALDCTGCIDATDIANGSVIADNIAPGAVQSYHVNFSYAGSASPGGPASKALDVECEGCVDASDLSFEAATLADVEALGPSLNDLGCNVGESPQMTSDGWGCAQVSLQGLSKGNASGYEIIDGWGYAWDGTERPSATWDDALARCAAVGARLPTVAELYRNRSNAPGAIGQSYDGNYLWTAIELDATTSMIGRWSNGTITTSTKVTKRNYRCVWPDHVSNGFSGDHCLGGCFLLEDGVHNMDREDRPPMPLMAAIRECAAVGARVPDIWEAESAIRNGLPNGSGQPTWTGDQYKGNNAGPPFIAVSWQGTKVSWFPPQNFSSTNAYHGYWPDNATPRTRCIGIADRSALTEPFGGTFAYGPGAAKADATDQDSVLYFDAIDLCRDEGGHLVDNVEAIGLVTAGWPGGDGAGIWTAEHHDLPMLTLMWKDVEKSFYPGKEFVASGSGFGSRWYSESFEHRCIYYSTVEWTEPDDCKGGCYTTHNGQSWMAMDKEDRTPQTYFDALDYCRQVGGRLPSTRDMEELVRLGAPNGGGVGVWTTSSYVASEGGPPKLTVRWSGTNKGWTPANDFTNGVVGYSGRWPGSPLPFRCVWTNEVY